MLLTLFLFFLNKIRYVLYVAISLLIFYFLSKTEISTAILKLRTIMVVIKLKFAAKKLVYIVLLLK